MSTTKTAPASKAFTAAELDAMKARIEEEKAAARRGSPANNTDGENDVLTKIAAATGSRYGRAASRPH